MTHYLHKGDLPDDLDLGYVVAIDSVSLYCPSNDLVHIGVWHGGAVVLMGIIGRFGLRRLLAW